MFDSIISFVATYPASIIAAILTLTSQVLWAITWHRDMVEVADGLIDIGWSRTADNYVRWFPVMISIGVAFSVWMIAAHPLIQIGLATAGIVGAFGRHYVEEKFWYKF